VNFAINHVVGVTKQIVDIIDAQHIATCDLADSASNTSFGD